MKFDFFKVFFLVVIAALIVGAGIYFRDNKIEGINETNENDTSGVEDVSEDSSLEDVSDSTVAVVEDDCKDLLSLAKTSADEFVYLVVAGDKAGAWNALVKDPFIGTFTFEYEMSPWGQLRYSRTDATATGGDPGPHGVPAIAYYDFCAGEYYCDMTQKQGMGFSMTFWDAQYVGKESDPEFYLGSGQKVLKQNENHIITYAPFDSSQTDFVDEVEKLMESFELIK